MRVLSSSSSRRIVILIVILILVIVLVPPILEEITTVRYVNSYEGSVRTELNDILAACIHEFREQCELSPTSIEPSDVVLRAVGEYRKYSSCFVSTNGIPLDPWRNPYYIAFQGFTYPIDVFQNQRGKSMEPTTWSVESPPDKSQTKQEKGKYVFMAWSSGKNGINEWGNGDDIREELPALLNHEQKNKDER